ncbi:hypothetical protein ACWCPQ_17040 [Nocardia sp. NPDC001965]
MSGMMLPAEQRDLIRVDVRTGESLWQVGWDQCVMPAARRRVAVAWMRNVLLLVCGRVTATVALTAPA